jgi:hypothetical protein
MDLKVLDARSSALDSKSQLHRRNLEPHRALPEANVNRRIMMHQFVTARIFPAPRTFCSCKRWQKERRRIFSLQRDCDEEGSGSLTFVRTPFASGARALEGSTSWRGLYSVPCGSHDPAVHPTGCNNTDLSSGIR